MFLKMLCSHPGERTNVPLFQFWNAGCVFGARRGFSQAFRLNSWCTLRKGRFQGRTQSNVWGQGSHRNHLASFWLTVPRTFKGTPSLSHLSQSCHLHSSWQSAVLRGHAQQPLTHHAHTHSTYMALPGPGLVCSARARVPRARGTQPGGGRAMEPPGNLRPFSRPKAGLYTERLVTGQTGLPRLPCLHICAQSLERSHLCKFPSNTRTQKSCNKEKPPTATLCWKSILRSYIQKKARWGEKDYSKAQSRISHSQI